MWLQKLSQCVSALAYSPNGETLYSLDYGGRVRAWNVATRAGRLLEYSGAVQDPEPHGRSLRALPDGEQVVVFASSVCVIGVNPRAFRWRAAPAGFPRYGKTLLTADGRLLAVRADRRAILTWDVLTHQPGPALREWPPRKGLLGFDLSDDGRTLAVQDRDDKHIEVIDLTSGEVRCRFRHGFEKGAVMFPRISRDGNTVIVRGADTIESWDVSDGAERVARIANVLPGEALAIHPKGAVCATVTRERALTLFDRSGEPVRALDLPLGKKIKCACFSPDGNTCAVGGSNGRFVVFDVDL